MTKNLIFEGDIVPKPRMTQRDKWQQRPCVIRYRGFCDHLRWIVRLAKFKMSSCVKMEFFLPIPKSWSKKKKQEYHNQPHQQKPDIDNLIKAVMDALNVDDAHIYHIEASKYWTNNKKGILFMSNIVSDLKEVA